MKIATLVLPRRTCNRSRALAVSSRARLRWPYSSRGVDTMAYQHHAADIAPRRTQAYVRRSAKTDVKVPVPVTNAKRSGGEWRRSKDGSPPRVVGYLVRIVSGF